MSASNHVARAVAAEMTAFSLSALTFWQAAGHVFQSVFYGVAAVGALLGGIASFGQFLLTARKELRKQTHGAHATEPGRNDEQDGATPPAQRPGSPPAGPTAAPAAQSTPAQESHSETPPRTLVETDRHEDHRHVRIHGLMPWPRSALNPANWTKAQLDDAEAMTPLIDKIIAANLPRYRPEPACPASA